MLFQKMPPLLNVAHCKMHKFRFQRAGSLFAHLWNGTGAPQARLPGRVSLMEVKVRKEQREVTVTNLDPEG